MINFLLTTEIIPLCLRIMETGSELSKTVAIFIVQKILLDDNGLNYICATYERFYAVGTVLSNMVGQLVEQQTARLLKHVVRCFLRYVLAYLSLQNAVWLLALTLSAGFRITTEPARPCDNVFQNHSETPLSLRSSATTRQLSDAWPSS